MPKLNTSGVERLNWKRAVFRSWVVISTLWVLLVFGWVALQTELSWNPFAPQLPIQVRISDKEIWEYPAAWGEKRIREDVTARLHAIGSIQRQKVEQMTTERRAFCHGLKDQTYAGLPGDCADYLWSAFTLEDGVPYSGWERQLIRPPSAAQTLTTFLPIAVAPPILLLALGAAVFWILAGFAC